MNRRRPSPAQGRLAPRLGWLAATTCFCLCCPALPARAAAGLEATLRRADPAALAAKVRLRGNARRGAILFHTSAAACQSCHAAGSGSSPLGPDLATPRPETKTPAAAIDHVIASLLEPSAMIRAGYETLTIQTVDGQVTSGLLVEENDDAIVLRNASDLLAELRVPRDSIEEISRSPLSMMPAGLVDSLADERDFLDLVRYVAEIAHGGRERERAIAPAPESLVVADDTAGLDHAGILRDLDERDLDAGRKIFNRHCVNCHGADGNTPRLPTARAFGRDELRFGSDPYRMFLTVSRGAGLMGALRNLSPRERYQVVHYVREGLMKDRNPQYQPVDEAYLASLPEGTNRGDTQPVVDRDYGPVLASQLGRRVNDGLTFRLPDDISVCYDLHRMQVAAAWQGGFLDLSETHHQKQRGERMPQIDGAELPGLAAWQWAFAGSFDAVEANKPPRGPLRDDWLTYHGHYLHGDRAILSYAIEGREILESIEVASAEPPVALAHQLAIGPGEPLELCVGRLRPGSGPAGMLPGDAGLRVTEFGPAGPGQIALVTGDPAGKARPAAAGPPPESGAAAGGAAASDAGAAWGTIAAAAVHGDAQGCTWSRDAAGRLVLAIPASDQPRRLRIVRSTLASADQLTGFRETCARLAAEEPADLASLTHGGPLRWPQTLTTSGTRGSSINGYALDTVTLPFENPWNAWLRTSAVDFFADGRCVVTTHGGDVYLVGGLDDDLDCVTWKRYAAGLFEPMGVRVVDGRIYVTCHDGLKRLHDLNGDGEADFIEAFWNDDDVSSAFHSYSFDLQTDSAGNFYLAKAGQYTDHHRPGSIMRIPPAGGSAEVVAWGIRTPNGMGILPDDRLTVSDNQGPWMPASKISLVREGSFLGNMPQNKEQTAWLEARHGGSLPSDFEEPIVWMPQEVDSSSGGQVWAGDPRLGPLAGRLIHSSFGKGWLYTLSLQEIGGTMQGAIVPLPHQWSAGVMRLRINPADGQLYGVGLSGWQGPRDGLDGCLERLRFTGEPVEMIDRVEVVPEGIELSFSFDVDPASVQRPGAFAAEMWNYLWSARYGSDQFSVREPGKRGHDALTIAAVQPIGPRRLRLVIPDLVVCDQLQLTMLLTGTSGQTFTDVAYLTIHAIPE